MPMLVIHPVKSLAILNKLVHVLKQWNMIHAGQKFQNGKMYSCTSLVYLDLCNNGIGDTRSEHLPGVLVPYTALDHLNLCYATLSRIHLLKLND